MEDFPTFLASRRSSIFEFDGFWPQGFGWSVFGVLDGRMVWLCDGWMVGVQKNACILQPSPAFSFKVPKLFDLFSYLYNSLCKKWILYNQYIYIYIHDPPWSNPSSPLKNRQFSKKDMLAFQPCEFHWGAALALGATKLSEDKAGRRWQTWCPPSENDSLVILWGNLCQSHGIRKHRGVR